MLDQKYNMFPLMQINEKILRYYIMYFDITTNSTFKSKYKIKQTLN